VREPRRQPSVDCSSGPLGPRANKRRFVNLLQQLAGAIVMAPLMAKYGETVSIMVVTGFTHHWRPGSFSRQYNSHGLM